MYIHQSLYLSYSNFNFNILLSLPLWQFNRNFIMYLSFIPISYRLTIKTVTSLWQNLTLTSVQHRKLWMRYFLRSTSLIQCLDVIVSIFKGVFNSLMFPSDQFQNLPVHLLQTQILQTKLPFQYLMNQSNCQICV